MRQSAFRTAVFLLLAVGTAKSQTGRPAALAGHVVDSATGEAVPGANVFLSGTLTGTATDTKGAFRIPAVDPGRYMLVASCVGYEPASLPVTLPDTVPRLIRLRPRLLQAQEILVTGSHPAWWKKLLGYFTKEFLGSTPNASRCTLENPEVLSLHLDSLTSILTASADRMLVVANRGLGYRLHIVLTSFAWNIKDDFGNYAVSVKFDTLVCDDGAELARWHARRQEAYRGSLKHFLAALIAGTLEQDGFEVHAGSLTELREGAAPPASAHDIMLLKVPDDNRWILSFDRWLRVNYRTRGERKTSYLSLNGDLASIDDKGNLLNPLSLEVLGDWTANRVAETIPNQ